MISLVIVLMWNFMLEIFEERKFLMKRVRIMVARSSGFPAKVPGFGSFSGFLPVSDFSRIFANFCGLKILSDLECYISISLKYISAAG
jgi:hypothetical protein